MSDAALPQSESQQICFPQMPLAVYRELAAHLRQVEGVVVELLPQSSQVFDYSQSQVGGLRLLLPPSLSASERVQQILAYYSQRYGAYSMAELA